MPKPKPEPAWNDGSLLEGMHIPGFPIPAIVQFSQSPAFNGTLEQRLQLAMPTIKLMVARKRYRDGSLPRESLEVMAREAKLYCEKFANNFAGSAAAICICHHAKNVYVTAKQLLARAGKQKALAAFRLGDALMGIEWELANADAAHHKELMEQFAAAAKRQTAKPRAAKQAKAAARREQIKDKIKELLASGTKSDDQAIHLASEQLAKENPDTDGYSYQSCRRAWFGWTK